MIQVSVSKNNLHFRLRDVTIFMFTFDRFVIAIIFLTWSYDRVINVCIVQLNGRKWELFDWFATCRCRLNKDQTKVLASRAFWSHQLCSLYSKETSRYNYEALAFTSERNKATYLLNSNILFNNSIVFRQANVCLSLKDLLTRCIFTWTLQSNSEFWKFVHYIIKVRTIFYSI